MKRFCVMVVALFLVACLMSVDAMAQCAGGNCGGSQVVPSGYSYAPSYSVPVYSSGVVYSSGGSCSSCSSSFMQRGPIRRVIASRASVPFMQRGPVRRLIAGGFCRRCQ